MSLHALASHMATKGRGGDSMLVHMTPGEVQALQTLAERSGGTLTINPETGQPEANFLKKMLPMIAGFALGPLGYGLTAGMAGLAVGGISALATGSLSRGLMAGLGAYGGASLGAGLAGASAGTPAANAAALGVEGAATGVGSQAAMLAEQTAGFGAEGLSSLADSARVAAGAAPSQAGMLSAGFDAVTKSPETLGKFAKSNFGALAAAASPLMAADTVETTTPRPDTGTIRNFTFDPYGQTYASAGNYPASEYKGMAQGGIVALAAGGFTDAQVASYIQNNELSGQALQNAADVFGLSSDQLGRAQSLISGNDASIQAASDAYTAAVAGRPDLVEQNLGFYNPAANTGSGWEDVVTNRGYSDALTHVLTAPDWRTQSGLTGQAGLSSNINDYVAKANALNWTPAEKRERAYDDMTQSNMNMADVVRATGKTIDELFPDTKKPPIKPTTVVPGITTTTQLPGGVSGGGNTVVNPNGTITTFPNIPGRPEGGFTGMGQVKDIYEQGGGSLGYVNPAPTTMEEFEQRFNRQTGDSLAAYEYLMGRGANPIKSGVGEIMRPYSEAVRGVPAAEGRPTQKYIYQDGRYVENPNYRPLSYNSKGERMVGMTSNEVIKGLQGLKDPTDDGALFDFVTENRIAEAQLAAALGISIAEARARLAAGKKKIGLLNNVAALIDSGGGGDDGDGAPGGDTGGDAGASGSAAGADGSGGGAGGCVDPNVMVLLADGGHVRAGDLRVGDMLHTLHEDTFVYGNFPVEFVEIIQQPKVEAGFDGSQKIIVSTTHKFLTADGVWKQMRDLVIGDVVRATGDATKKLTSVKTLGEGPVVKMTVTDAHTYIADGLVSHNKARGGMVRRMALGGLGALAAGGATSQYNLGDYSDGGRLLRGPGDGVSDSIPASIGNKRPARLADGEFVVPARIVSELGNGSTEAGARKLYAMMDRVQKARGKTTGKNRVAANTRSDKYLPA